VNSPRAVDKLRHTQVDNDTGESECLASREPVLALHEVEHPLDGERGCLVEVFVEAECQPRLRRLERRPIGLVRPMVPLDGGLIIPTICPLAASTKRVFALVSCAIRQAERQGTMWSFSAPIA